MKKKEAKKGKPMNMMEAAAKKIAVKTIKPNMKKKGK